MGRKRRSGLLISKVEMSEIFYGKIIIIVNQAFGEKRTKPSWRPWRKLFLKYLKYKHALNSFFTKASS